MRDLCALRISERITVGLCAGLCALCVLAGTVNIAAGGKAEIGKAESRNGTGRGEHGLLTLTTDHRFLKMENDEDVRESGQNRLAGRVEPNRSEPP